MNILTSILRTHFLDYSIDIIFGRLILIFSQINDADILPQSPRELEDSVRSGAFYDKFGVLISMEDVSDGLEYLGFNQTMELLMERIEKVRKQGFPEL